MFTVKKCTALSTLKKTANNWTKYQQKEKKQKVSIQEQIKFLEEQRKFKKLKNEENKKQRNILEKQKKFLEKLE